MNALCRSSASTNSSGVMMPFSTKRSRKASTAAVDATIPPSAGSSGSSGDMPHSLPPRHSMGSCHAGMRASGGEEHGPTAVTPPCAVDRPVPRLRPATGPSLRQ